RYPSCIGYGTSAKMQNAAIVAVPCTWAKMPSNTLGEPIARLAALGRAVAGARFSNEEARDRTPPASPSLSKFHLLGVTVTFSATRVEAHTHHPVPIKGRLFGGEAFGKV